MSFKERGVNRRGFFYRAAAAMLGASALTLTSAASTRPLRFNAARGRLEWVTVMDGRTRWEYERERKHGRLC